VYGLAFSPDAQQLAVGFARSKGMGVWEVQTGSELWTLDYDAEVKALCWSADGTLLFVLVDGVHILYARTKRTVRVLPAPSPRWFHGRALTVSPDGRLLATYAEDTDEEIQLWDISALGVGPKGGGAVGQSALDL